ncbi:MAG: hypothetical protein LBH74_07415 [Nitrososphaerota archaeon]|jgi:hypothetical protein|nr:hypothetical protein [Nitrososphaerota archaeon]
MTLAPLIFERIDTQICRIHHKQTLYSVYTFLPNHETVRLLRTDHPDGTASYGIAIKHKLNPIDISIIWIVHNHKEKP